MIPEAGSITGLELHEHRTVTAEVSGMSDMQWQHRKNRLRPDRIVVVMEREGDSPWLVTRIEVHGARVLANGAASTNQWQRGDNYWGEAWTTEPDHERRRRSAVDWSGIPVWAVDFAGMWCAEFNAARTSDAGVSLLRGVADVAAGRVQRLDPT